MLCISKSNNKFISQLYWFNFYEFVIKMSQYWGIKFYIQSIYLLHTYKKFASLAFEWKEKNLKKTTKVKSNEIKFHNNNKKQSSFH